ncbi:MAG: CHASE2 domain-containing protein [Bryobacteraceae bacterium]
MSLRKHWPAKSVATYAALLAGCWVITTVIGWRSFARQVDNDAYDWMMNPPRLDRSDTRNAQAVVVTIDDATFHSMGGVRNLRSITAQALERIAAARPKVTAIDLILADPGDAREDARLEAALHNTRNLVLATDLVNGAWENPLPRFGSSAAAIGHAMADEESQDGVTREISLERAVQHERYWALALQAYRLSRGARDIRESPQDLEIAGTIIPARRNADGRRRFLIRYQENGLPRFSFKQLDEHPELLATVANKVVFLGVYSNTASRDRVVTPLRSHVSGVEVNAHVSGVEVNAEAFETLADGHYLHTPRDSTVLAYCALIATLAGICFALLAGWPAYLLGAALIATAHGLPFILFRSGIVFPYFGPVSTAWLTVIAASIYQHFVVRRQLRSSESERSRYREAIHWVTHEMRSPLTTIQGSSELIGRYNLNDDKRKQIAYMINSESKRLARMIQTFLDMERLSEGEMEWKKEPFEVSEVVHGCLDRVRPLAEKKNMGIAVDGELGGTLQGDRELMEYAIYNLLTNAIKYSPSETQVTVSSRPQGEYLRLSIQDQGIGMDAKELRKIFTKFYRTKRAEASGEAGTGIGLSIVDQIVKHHGGHMEVTSTPNLGSCFTVVLRC